MIEFIEDRVYRDGHFYGGTWPTDDGYLFFDIHGNEFGADDLRQIADKLDELNGEQNET